MYLCKTITRFIIPVVFMVGLRAVCIAQQLPAVHNTHTAQIPEAEFANAQLPRNLTIAYVLLSSVIIARIYWRYNSKKISSVAIANKNLLLEQLLEEKDLLLKEVHHRVTNNLQIVISLLNAQSAYLENNIALAALRESRNRVQAISLIHQKLSRNNNLTAIDMPAYVLDMVNQLRDCLDTTQRGIRFRQSIAPVKIELSQAVPLGLILNEAITNAVKYAFGEDGGAIIINLQLTDDETAKLTIIDNGKGMPEDFDLKQDSSLGMEMMKALSKQLGASFKIDSKKGVTICIEFKLERAVTALSKKVYGGKCPSKSPPGGRLNFQIASAYSSNLV